MGRARHTARVCGERVRLDRTRYIAQVNQASNTVPTDGGAAAAVAGAVSKLSSVLVRCNACQARRRRGVAREAESAETCDMPNCRRGVAREAESVESVQAGELWT